MMLEAHSLGKSFGAVQALSAGDLKLQRGEIHALMGANGCGKSTLCKIIAGTLAANSGQMFFEGEEVRFTSPRSSETAGIALFYQELSLVPQLTVSDNIFIGREPKKFGLVDRAKMDAAAAELIALFSGVIGQSLTPSALVGDLPPDLRQIVEILKVFAKEPKLMIMDEATAALDGRQAERFFSILRMKAREGASVIMITHRLDEVFAVCDRITVMRNGKTITLLDTAQTTQAEVIHHMIGEVKHMGRSEAPMARRSVSLSLRDGGNEKLKDINFDAYQGEILGLGGLQGQGQSALLQALFGDQPLTQGRFSFEGRILSMRSPRQAVREGFAYVSGDRARDGALTGRPILENLISAFNVKERVKILIPKRLIERASQAAATLKTKYANLEDPINTLSGGNQQKIFIARWQLANPKVLLLDDPTKGIDLGAKADLFALMRAQADAGATVLLYSSEDAELLENADRVLVFNGGRIAAELVGDRLTAQNLTRAAFGEVS